MRLGLGFQVVADGEESLGKGVTVAIVDVVLQQALDGAESYRGQDGP